MRVKKTYQKIIRALATHKLISIVSLVLFVGAIAFVGYGVWQQMSAKAAEEDSLTTTQRQYILPVNAKQGCRLAGRVWDDATSQCRQKCRVDSATFVKATDTRRAYCEGYVVWAIGPARCIGDLHRYYVKETGCARRPNQENTNDSPQCIPGYPNYLAERDTDKCIAPDIAGANQGSANQGTKTTQPTPPPTDIPQPTPAPVKQPSTASAKDCHLLGRVWDTKEKKCKAECMAGAGVLLVGAKSGVKYCSLSIAVTKNGTQDGCENKLHRVWLVEGCARRPDQKDAARGKSELLIQCQEGFNFYNANFNNIAEDTQTLRDVCERSKAIALANEQAGTPGHAPIPRDPSDPNPGTGDGHGSDSSGYKIIVYSERDFKGASRTITDAMPELNSGWNDNIESYKIISGRWQLCEDKEYVTNCIKPWASDPDMRLPLKDDGKNRNNDDQKKRNDENRRTTLANKVSSLRPVLLKTFEDTADDVKPACLSADGTQTVAFNEDGTCPDGTKLACPDGLVLKNQECKQVVLSPNLIVPVDKSFKKEKNGERDCHLLGREWIGKPEDGEVDNGGDYGCSIVTCRFDIDGHPKRLPSSGQQVTDTVCISNKYDAPYAVKLDKDPVESKKKCEERHRVWIQQVDLCAQVPNRKDRNQTVVDAPQCAGSGRVYYIFKETSKTDECFTQTLFERAQSVAKSTGGVLEAALKQGPRAYCNSVKRGNYHWNGDKCVIDRKICWNGKSIPVTQKCPAKPAPQGTSQTDDPATPGDQAYLDKIAECHSKGYLALDNPPRCSTSCYTAGGYVSQNGKCVRSTSPNPTSPAPTCPNGGHWDPVLEICKGPTGQTGPSYVSCTSSLLSSWGVNNAYCRGDAQCAIHFYSATGTRYNQAHTRYTNVCVYPS